MNVFGAFRPLGNWSNPWERGPIHRQCGSGRKYKANGLRKWWRSRDQHQGRRAAAV